MKHCKQCTSKENFDAKQVHGVLQGHIFNEMRGKWSNDVWIKANKEFKVSKNLNLDFRTRSLIQSK